MNQFLKLKPNAKARVLAGHPWVFANECEALPDGSVDGAVIDCRDRAGRFLGSGIYNSRSQIVWRRLSRERVALDEAFLRGALARAIERRRPADGAGTDRFQRLVWSESDDLPGIVVDRYGDTLVVQIQTIAMEGKSELLGALLAELLQPEEIVFRNDANIRRLEGLPLEVHTRSGRPWEPRWQMIDGIEYWLDLQSGQKTGFYLDQRLQHGLVASAVRQLASARSEPPRVLDAFCNQGAFALHCASAGAGIVLGLDSAPDAIEQARRNATRNGLQAEFLETNVFDWFTGQRETAAAWDAIILDPPPFAKSKASLPGAMRGYKELNLRAMKALRPSGLLATYSCSHHMQERELRQVLAEAAADARRHVQIVGFCHQPADHPVLVTMPESEYLRGFLLRVE